MKKEKFLEYSSLAFCDGKERCTLWADVWSIRACSVSEVEIERPGGEGREGPYSCFTHGCSCHRAKSEGLRPCIWQCTFYLRGNDANTGTSQPLEQTATDLLKMICEEAHPPTDKSDCFLSCTDQNCQKQNFLIYISKAKCSFNHLHIKVLT